MSFSLSSVRRSALTLDTGPILRRPWTATFSWLAAAMICFGMLPSIGADSIVFVDGRRADDCTIESAQWSQVRYTVGNGGAQSAPGDRIESIHRTPRGAGLASGRRALDDGKYGAAIKALSQGGGVEWEIAETAYLLAKAHAANGDAKKAAAQYQEYVSKHEAEKDWWLPHALYDLGLLQLSTQKTKSADQTFAKLEVLGGNWAARAQLGRARGALIGKAQSKYQGHQTKLRRVATNQRAPAALRAEAYVIRAQLLVAGKQHERAINELRSIFFNPSKTRDNVYTVWRAEATLTLGLAYLDRGGKANLEQAEIWLLRVPALYPNEGAVYCKACVALARVYDGLGNGDRAAEWKKRGRNGSDSP